MRFNTNSSPSTANMARTGRGGAGNSESYIKSMNDQISKDLEANQQDADADLEPYQNSESISDSQRAPSGYSHMGRGGAGNYYSPDELARDGHFEESTTTDDNERESSVVPQSGDRGMRALDAGSPGVASTSAAQASVGHRGRGGAGNFEYGARETEDRAAKGRLHNEQAMQRLRGEIEDGVRAELAMPEKAKLSGGNSYGG